MVAVSGARVAAAHSAALPSKNRGRQTQAPKREAESGCDVLLSQRCEHKLQERIAHVSASRSDNVCVRLSTQSSTHNMEEDRNDQSKPVGRREKRNGCVEPVLKMRRAQGREEVARDQV